MQLNSNLQDGRIIAPGSIDTEFEMRVRETGMWLFGLVEGESPSIFQKEYWLGKLMQACMQDEQFKIQMFRFVDVFPYLKSSKSLASHLLEYFARPGLTVPALMRWALRFVSPSSISARLITRAISSNLHTLARQFMVGSDPSHALTNLESLRSEGMAFSIDLLGEAVISESEAEEYMSRYISLYDFLSNVTPRWNALGETSGKLDWGYAPKANISIKTSAMYSQMNASAFEHSVNLASERLRRVMQKAKETETSTYIDMEHYGMKNMTLELFRRVLGNEEFSGYTHGGMVIQAYLKDSEADLLDIIEWAKMKSRQFTIRLVKGAYWDSEVVWAAQKNWPVPVFTEKHLTDANFEKLARIILKNSNWVRLACASHNMRSIAAVIESARALDVPQDRYEFQVLYGMGEPVRNALCKAGLPTRVYSPIGDMIQGMSYLVRRLLENTANESFLRRSFSENIPREALLQNPLELGRAHEISSGLTAQPSSQPEPFRNEPAWDWSLVENRSEFSIALAGIRKTFPLKVPIVIGQKKIRAKKEIISRNPNKLSETVGKVSAASSIEAELAITAASHAFPSWRDTSPERRSEFLFRAAEIARKRRRDLAALQVFETGKGWSEADGDVCEAIDFLEYYGREMLRLSRPLHMGNVPGETSRLFYEPRGVAVVIAPWNFPLAISTGMTSAALVSGNTVIYKPASQSPVVGHTLYRLFEDARLPAGVLNYLPGSGSEIGDQLVRDPRVALIAFTGSRDTGLQILKYASEVPEGAAVIKNVIAEMGGKNAVILDSDADLDEAISQVLYSAFGYQGQKCSACSRLIVLDDIYERSIDRLRAAAESVHLGPVEYPWNYMGAVIEPSAYEKIMSYVDLAKREGKLLVERRFGDDTGLFAPLTIVTDVEPGSRIAQEEIFGPVLAVIRARDFDDALKIANETQYALTGSVFSRSPRNIAKAQREFRVGNLYINRGCTGAIVGRHPFGGFKMSGVGSKSGGPDYLLQFMVPRNTVENTLRRGFAPDITESLK